MPYAYLHSSEDGSWPSTTNLFDGCLSHCQCSKDKSDVGNCLLHCCRMYQFEWERADLGAQLVLLSRCRCFPQNNEQIYILCAASHERLCLIRIPVATNAHTGFRREADQGHTIRQHSTAVASMKTLIFSYYYLNCGRTFSKANFRWFNGPNRVRPAR